MTLRIIAQNRLHRPIADAIQDSNGFIENLCVQASPQSPLWGVDPAADTMFNEYQLNAIIDDLEARQSVENSGLQHIRELRTVAIIAARKGGYLWFYGSHTDIADNAGR